MTEDHSHSKFYWECPLCDILQQFESEGCLEDHFGNLHRGTVSDISKFIQGCAKPKILADIGCPLCSVTEDTKDPSGIQLLNHVAEHIHSFSFSSLPTLTVEGNHEKINPYFETNPYFADDSEDSNDASDGSLENENVGNFSNDEYGTVKDSKSPTRLPKTRVPTQPDEDQNSSNELSTWALKEVIGEQITSQQQYLHKQAMIKAWSAEQSDQDDPNSTTVQFQTGSPRSLIQSEMSGLYPHAMPLKLAQAPEVTVEFDELDSEVPPTDLPHDAKRVKFTHPLGSPIGRDETLSDSNTSLVSDLAIQTNRDDFNTSTGKPSGSSNRTKWADVIGKTSKVYNHNRIPENQVRLLFIKPGAFADQINASLLVVSDDDLGSDHSPYSALSYDWGDGTADNVIVIQDDPDSTPVNFIGNTVDHLQAVARERTLEVIKVMPNLYEALRHIRSETHSVTLWVDALCINQFDNKEKEEQVLKMAQIYHKAYNVHVWLGSGRPGDLVSNRAMDFIYKVIDSDNLSELLTRDKYIEDWASLYELLKSSW